MNGDFTAQVDVKFTVNILALSKYNYSSQQSKIHEVLIPCKNVSYYTNSFQHKPRSRGLIQLNNVEVL